MHIEVTYPAVRSGDLLGRLEHSGGNPAQDVRVGADDPNIRIALPFAAMLFHAAEVRTQSGLRRILVRRAIEPIRLFVILIFQAILIRQVYFLVSYKSVKCRANAPPSFDPASVLS